LADNASPSPETATQFQPAPPATGGDKEAGFAHGDTTLPHGIGVEPALRYHHSNLNNNPDPVGDNTSGNNYNDGSIMTVSIDGSVRLLRQSDGQCMTLMLPSTTSQAVMGVTHSPSQELIFVLLGGTEISVFCCRTSPCKFLQRWTLPQAHEAPVTCMVMCDRMPEATESNFRMRHGQSEREEERLVNVRGRRDSSLVLDQYPEVLAIGNTEGTIQFLDSRKSGKIRGIKQVCLSSLRRPSVLCILSLLCTDCLITCA
jgi:hypothetical protein